MKKQFLNVLAIIILFIIPIFNYGQAPNLGAASSFALFTAAGAFDNTGASVITGNIGSNTYTPTGFPVPGTVIGNIYHAGDALAIQAATDVGVAYGYLSTLGGTVLGVTMVNGQTITPGVWSTNAASTLNGTLTLDGQGDPNALFIIRIGGAFATGTFSNVVLTNSASLCNVYWQINGQFDLENGSVFRGTVVANGAINLLGNSILYGRALTRAGAIALHANVVTLGLAPTASSISTNGVTTFCTGSNVILSGNNNGVWSNAATTPTITVSTNGDYYVTNTTACGSVNSNHILVTVNPLPDAPSGNITQPSCAVSTGTFTTTTPIPATGISYTITGINPVVAAINNTTGVFSGLIPGAYNVTTTNVNGCTSLAYSIIILANQNTPVAPVTSVIQPTCVVPTGTITVTNPAPALDVSYTLIGTNPVVASVTNTTGVFSNLAIGTYNLSYTNASECNSYPSSITITSSLTSLPTPTITGLSSVCNSTTGVTYTTESGMTNYNWNINGGTITAGTGTNTITVTWNTAGTENVSVNYTNANGCNAATATVYNVNVNANPSPSITGTPNNGYYVHACDTIVYCTPYVAGNLYSWSAFGKVSYTTPGFRNCISVEFVNPCGVYGEWVISVTETNPLTGCTTTTTKNVFIYQ